MSRPIGLNRLPVLPYAAIAAFAHVNRIAVFRTGYEVYVVLATSLDTLEYLPRTQQLLAARSRFPVPSNVSRWGMYILLWHC